MKHITVRPSSMARPRHPYFVACRADALGEITVCSTWGTTHEAAAERAYDLNGSLPTLFYCNYDGRLP